MLEKKHLSHVSELNFAEKIDNLNEDDFLAFSCRLDLFIDEISNRSARIKKALEYRRMSEYKQGLSEVCDILFDIHADRLAAKARTRIGEIFEESLEDAENFTEQFLLDVSSLSIEIQMAAYKNGDASSKKKKSSANAVILAVDNAHMFLNTLTRLLANTSYELHCVSSGQEALEFLKTKKPDVILLDIEMPEMNGYELARNIRETGTKAPVIFITAYSDREYIDKAIASGAAGLLMKPLRINQLLTMITEVMR